MLVSRDELAYDTYTAMCSRVGVLPLNFSDWYCLVERLNPDQAAGSIQFHGGNQRTGSGSGNGSRGARLRAHLNPIHMSLPMMDGLGESVHSADVVPGKELKFRNGTAVIKSVWSGSSWRDRRANG